ncbi:hypothetical protein AE929_09610 [Xanthomonas arboricola]|uniref:Uncharacterized protein n=1 Tax=Xanthomonas campestris pv. juglandis TaxID=195709 RepID=A0A8E4GFL5_XANCJ|nr:hypothetical protein [Xanthomonas arboricola]KOA98601.1 hypothetical protein AE920_14965 [Xanthomonas arboricola]KOB16851.1 hypothetical protein AE924_06820 [Xanthomonas arboricola]KOB25233.1 hypothetical protein AE927_16080 [Xanthomonas arboricola]KOB35697.1 hypothetical protein AE929_09610 [Xanthomonas arboricola]KOB45391.1 hypothetical protein AE931_05310 [Xanthomonas arboricola]
MYDQHLLVGTSVAITIAALAGLGTRLIRKRVSALDAEAFMRCPVGDDYALQLILAVKQLPEAQAVDALIRRGDLDSVGASIQWFVQRLGVDAERKCGAFFDNGANELLPVFDPQAMGLALPIPASYQAYVCDGHRYTATVYDLDEKAGRLVMDWLELHADSETAGTSHVVDSQVRDSDRAADNGSRERDPLCPDRHSASSIGANSLTDHSGQSAQRGEA